jgi:hypothetical protein
LNRINTLIQQGINHKALHTNGRHFLKPFERLLPVPGHGREIQRRKPVSGQVLQELTATGKGRGPNVAPGNGQQIERSEGRRAFPGERGQSFH